MNILAIDTSTKFLSLGIVLDGKIVLTKDICAHLKTSSIIIPTIDKILKKLKLSLNNFDAFCVGLGPGSFTGLRIGISTIKAFGFCLKKKIIGLSSLDIIASNANLDGNICVVVDAKRKLLYAGFYKMKNDVVIRQGKIKLLTIDSVIGYNNCRGTKYCAPTYFLGDGVAVYNNAIKQRLGNSFLLEERFWYPRARNLCLAAIGKFKNKEFISLDNLRPLYIYPKDCQIRKVKS